MSTIKQSKNFWAGALVASVALIGSVHADILSYSSEDFEGGIPNYTLTTTNGTDYVLTQLQDSGGTNISSHVALSATDYTPGSPTRSGIWANSNLPGTIVNEPDGKHGFVCRSSNRNLTLTNPMTLASDGVTSLDISFDTMLYAYEDDKTTETNDVFFHTIVVSYSPSGVFTDAVVVATYATTNMATPVVYPAEPVSILGHTTLVEDTWSTLNLSLSYTDVTFTDTAKIRFNKMAPNLENQMVFYDNISVTGVIPSPGTLIMVH